MGTQALPRTDHALGVALRRLASIVSFATAAALVAIKLLAWIATGSVAMLTSAVDALVDTSTEGPRLIVGAIEDATEKAVQDLLPGAVTPRRIWSRLGLKTSGWMNRSTPHLDKSICSSSRPALMRPNA